MTHPEESLAAYVDGSLGANERAEVEAHLSSCATCREEVELAARARPMLAALPELDVPPGTVRPETERIRALRPARARRVRWAAGLAAAAALAAIFGLVLVGNGGSPGGTLAGRQALPGPQVVHQPRDYDAAALQGLAATFADRLASKRADQAELSAVPGSAGSNAVHRPAVPSPSPALGGAGTFSSLSGSPAACLRAGAGVTGPKRPLRIIQARYRGTPAYIGAFVQAVPAPAVVVWAVARSGCTVLATARVRIP